MGEFTINEESVSRICPWGQGTSLRGEELLRAQVVAGQVGSLKIGSYGVSLICAKMVFECYVSCCFLTLSYYFVLAFRSWSLLLFSSMF